MGNFYLICERIALIKENKNPYFVRELNTGYVVIGDQQRIKGYKMDKERKIDENGKEISDEYKMEYKSFKMDKRAGKLCINLEQSRNYYRSPRL